MDKTCCSTWEGTPPPLNNDQVEDLARMCKALGHPVRLHIIQHLATHPGCITGDIVNVLPVAQATTSQHLAVLKEAGLIRGTTEGPATCYCLEPTGLAHLRASLGRLFPAEYPHQEQSHG